MTLIEQWFPVIAVLAVMLGFVIVIATGSIPVAFILTAGVFFYLGYNKGARVERKKGTIALLEMAGLHSAAKSVEENWDGGVDYLGSPE